ncbi:response regulator [bacterium]|nr:response regulator [bacterium]
MTCRRRCGHQVVDDNDMDRMITEEFVNEIGFEVVTAGSGEECIQLLTDMTRETPGSRAPPVGLILLDVLMPNMDGYEVCLCLASSLVRPTLHP